MTKEKTLALLFLTKNFMLQTMMSLYLSGFSNFFHSKFVAEKNCGYSVIIMPMKCKIKKGAILDYKIAYSLFVGVRVIT